MPLRDSTTSDSPPDSPMSEDSPIQKEPRPIGRKASKAKKAGNSSNHNSKFLEEIARQNTVRIEMEQKRQDMEVTIHAECAQEKEIKNSANWGSYKFNAANVTYQYQGATVGVIDIAKGKAGWLSTIKRNVEVSLSSSAITGSNLGSELSSGVLTLNSVGRLNGKVAIMFIMKKKKATNMNCTIAFDVAAKTLKSLQCK
ncbi:PREDICTED: uncharacterized protein LOC103337709 [Prunus mume]|uniref:Uncharacterized protein LOC103337709 n=1 Tax=Prunus mume TaxID=102107 RepID=A0ABM0PG10_PRUMU|nr:PREDICTED: uncharacterized protein LOC103337709 [Prunus mume]